MIAINRLPNICCPSNTKRYHFGKRSNFIQKKKNVYLSLQIGVAGQVRYSSLWFFRAGMLFVFLTSSAKCAWTWSTLNLALCWKGTHFCWQLKLFFHVLIRLLSGECYLMIFGCCSVLSILFLCWTRLNSMLYFLEDIVTAFLRTYGLPFHRSFWHSFY